MNTTRILLLGSTGLLGSAIKAVAKGDGCTVIAPTRQELDLLSPDAGREFLKYFEWTPPIDVVINCAAIANPDFVKDKMDLITMNVIRPLEFANLCGNRGIKYVHIRSCHEGMEPYNDYSRSKTTAYHALKTVNKDHIYFIRIGWVFGDDPKNRVAKQLIGSALCGKDFKATNDRWMSPCYNIDLAQEILKVVQQKDPGEFTIANRGVATFADVASIAWDELRAKGTLTPVKSNDKIPRPLHAELQGTLRHWSIAWREYLEKVKARGYA